MKYKLLRFDNNETFGVISQEQFDHLKTYGLLKAPINWVGRISVDSTKLALGGGVLGGSVNFRAVLPELELPPKTMLLFTAYVTVHMLKEKGYNPLEVQLRILP